MATNIFQDWQGIPTKFDTPSDGVSYSIAVANRVWDPNTLSWVNQTQSGGGGGGSVTQGTTPWVDNISQFGGNPVVTGTGISGVGVPRMTVASDSFGTDATGVTYPAGAAGVVGWLSGLYNVTATGQSIITDVPSSSVMYVGKAAAGSSQAASVWRISKVVTDANGGITLQYASGSPTYNQVWNNRASLSYS